VKAREEWSMAADPINWPEGTNLQPLILSLYGTISPRKQRLCAAAFCRRVAHLLPDDRCRSALDVAERYADRRATRAELTAANLDVDSAWRALAGLFLARAEDAPRYAVAAAFWATHPKKRHFADKVADSAAAAVACTDAAHWSAAHAQECAAQLHLLRDVLGPGGPPAVDPRWLAWSGGLVVRLAAGTADQGRFEQLPVLADALEEAGCTEQDILKHCRGLGPHTRGCWVIDLLLGKQ
jgi:hypothetical protein